MKRGFVYFVNGALQCPSLRKALKEAGRLRAQHVHNSVTVHRGYELIRLWQPSGTVATKWIRLI